ncbi:MAG: hypothetical protein E7472_05225 [Ruminococcaceae bacterium]|nr:hypothetical protein [Oscillospiraceae bacterium]
MINAQELLREAQRDAAARLRWQVMRRLGVCPLSLRGRMLSRRGALRIACQMVLDGRAAAGNGAESGGNPCFDEARFRALAGGGLVDESV